MGKGDCDIILMVDPRFYVIADSTNANRQIVGKDFLSFFGWLVLIII